jgi:predicted ribosome quality control (RQC) complex YloA/Tae2 family protein
MTCDARNQAKIATILMAVIPALSLFYIGMSTFSDTDYLPLSVKLLIFILSLTLAATGFLILRKYPDNILKLRQYITELAKGTLPDKIILKDTQNSDDIKYIEESFNLVLAEMQRRIETAKEQLRIEHQLKKTIEQQQQALLDAERQRVMILTLCTACHHIGQPATVLQLKLDLLKERTTDKNELIEINECIQTMQQITDMIHQLQRVSEFRTVPYIHTEGLEDEEILEISSST